jgi:molybdenum cofactor guanylyltransferase
VAVGDCHPDVAARADRHIPDRHPGVGPLGGIITALETEARDVFVLPGDLPGMTADAIQAILEASVADASAGAVLASTDRPEPCIGIYRLESVDSLTAALRDRRALVDALPSARRRLVPIDAGAAANANTPEDLKASHGAGGPSTRR